MGKRKKQWLLYVIDYGLAKRFRDPKTGEHIRYRDKKNLTGTARYTSLNTHLGIEQSRRDDLEGIAYSLIYFLRGSLPWQGLPAKTKKEKYDQIRELKLSTAVETLCKGLPIEFASFLSYCRQLSFEEAPDYGFARRLFSDLFRRRGFEKDYVFDWTVTRVPSKSFVAPKGMLDLVQSTDYSKQKFEEVKLETLVEPMEEDDKPQMVKPTRSKPTIGLNHLIYRACTPTQRGSVNSTPDKVRMRDIVNICDKVPF
eukprot:TRINITY_DN3590_c0_g8_i1.p1 TRINITY_DN3590_c0_g8~~TRINITY_DN3590_c0_g8_i1.p1  ORF type:complete len:255 (-),score=53.90 TRINITY_DN3590_c0_g8_i1:94-858(-)